MSMSNFIVLSRIGKKDFLSLFSAGSGSFSEVFKVKRISDGQEYALKKVTYFT